LRHVYGNKEINIFTCLYRCDRILSYGEGTRLLSYNRAELILSDHRPVTAVYMADVEIVCPRRLQRALTFSNAEAEDHLLSRKEAHLEPKTN
jgi:type I inositol polyphosphate 5-phosphatase IP5P1/2